MNMVYEVFGVENLSTENLSTLNSKKTSLYASVLQGTQN